MKSFKIYVSNQSISDTSTTAKLLATITDTLKYSDASVVNGTRYYYRVKAVDTSIAANLSPYSNEFAVTPNIPPSRIDSLLISTAPRAALLKWSKQAAGIKYLVLSGTKIDSLSVLANKIDSNLIKGCQSKLWLHAELNEEKLIFKADSEAIITKGIAAVLLRVFSNQTPKNIIEANLEFIDKIGLKEHLSPTRANGLVSMIKQIKLYAIAQQTKLVN